MTDFERRIADLEAQLAELRQLVRTDLSGKRPTTATVEEVNRPALLRRSGIAIAGAAAGGVALVANAQPAAAADNAAIFQGQTNTGTLTTTIATTSTNPTLIVNGRANVSTAASNGPAPLVLGQQFPSDGRPPATGFGNTGSKASIVRTDNNAADLWFAHVGADKAALSSQPQRWGRVQTSHNSNFI